LSTASSDRYTDFSCDVTHEDRVKEVVARVIGDVGVPEIVVNNAGTFLLSPLAETTKAEFEEHLAVNVMGSFFVLRELLPHLIRLDRAHIVTIGSVADHVPFPGNAAYGASKYGLRGLHEVVTRELSTTDVRATLISPGPTNTSLWEKLDSEGETLMDRADMLHAEDVAEAVLFAVTRPPRANVELIRISPAVQ
jgi:NADP-dependent 3-hydroxy acid dehydrogenase YdfG